MVSASSARPATRSPCASSTPRPSMTTSPTSPTRPSETPTSGEEGMSMNYYDTLIEVADDCPAKEAQVPQARGAKKTQAVVEYELLTKHPYKYTEETHRL